MRSKYKKIAVFQMDSLVGIRSDFSCDVNHAVSIQAVLGFWSIPSKDTDFRTGVLQSIFDIFLSGYDYIFCGVVFVSSRYYKKLLSHCLPWSVCIRGASIA